MSFDEVIGYFVFGKFYLNWVYLFNLIYGYFY